MIKEFLSSKHNVYGLMVACYVMIGVILSHNMTSQQVLITIGIIIVSNLLWYIVGIGRGMVLAAIQSTKGWDRVIDKIKEMNKKNKKD